MPPYIVAMAWRKHRWKLQGPSLTPPFPQTSHRRTSEERLAVVQWQHLPGLRGRPHFTDQHERCYFVVCVTFCRNQGCLNRMKIGWRQQMLPSNGLNLDWRSCTLFRLRGKRSGPIILSWKCKSPDKWDWITLCLDVKSFFSNKRFLKLNTESA